MTPPSASQVLALADSVGWKTCVGKERAERSQEGQFFTPPPIAGFLAGRKAAMDTGKHGDDHFHLGSIKRTMTTPYRP